MYVSRSLEDRNKSSGGETVMLSSVGFGNSRLLNAVEEISGIPSLELSAVDGRELLYFGLVNEICD